MIALVASSLFIIQMISNATHSDFKIASLLNKTQVTTVIAQNKEVENDVPPTIKHIVHSGENLTSISLQYCHSDKTTMIAESNHLQQPNNIHNGDVLTFNCTE